MKVLVTGAAGFIGSRVVVALASRGHSVRALVRPGSAARCVTFGWPEEVELVEADLRSSLDLESAVGGVEAVAHLAAQVNGSDEARFASTVGGTERLLVAIRDGGVRRLVQVSSYSVYDWHRVGPVLDEDSAFAERPYDRDGYAVAKVWQERVIREAAASGGLELVVLRPGYVWGPGHAEQAGTGIRLPGVFVVFGRRTRLPLTFVDNCAECVTLAVEVPEAAGETFNVVDDEVVTAWEYARLQARCTGERIRRIAVPYPVALAGVRTVAAISQRLFEHGGKLPSVLVPTRFEARFRPVTHSARKAEQILGWRAKVGYAEGLSRTFGSDSA